MSALVGDVNAIRALAEELLELPREDFEAALDTFEPALAVQISRCWQLSARPSQLRPRGCKQIWLRQAGRGEGKTRSAAEECLDTCEDWGPTMRGLLASKTIGDVRDVMIEGESGLLACAHRRGYQVQYIANRGVVEHPAGGRLHVVSSEKPDKPRGYQSNYVWGDEIAAWMHAIPMFDNLVFGWRLRAPDGGPPRMTLTTTPKPNDIMRRLILDAVWKDRVTITRGSTYDNAANLSPEAVALLDAVYSGTTLGRQELLGEMLAGLGAIWIQETIAAHRIHHYDTSTLDRRIVSLDPSITSKDTSDAAGIIVVGADALEHPHAYVLDDQTQEQATWPQWGRQTIASALQWDCDAIVAETNQGGEGIVEQLWSSMGQLGLSRDAIPIRTVWATKSKAARAEPVGSLYQRGRVHHVGDFPQLEKEMCGWLPGGASPNRMDALVHGVTHLLLGERLPPGFEAYLT